MTKIIKYLETIALSAAFILFIVLIVFFSMYEYSTTKWLIALGVLVVIGLLIFDYRRNGSLIKKIDLKKVPLNWTAIIITIVSIIVLCFVILPRWDRHIDSIFTQKSTIPFVSHSVTTGTLQTQHVSTASATVSAEDMRLLITLGEKYTWQPGAVYVWRKEPVQKYFLPVQCNTSITVFVHTDDRSSHYMYQACRDADGKASYREYDHTGTMPDGYVKATLIGDAEVEMKYTAYLK